MKLDCIWGFWAEIWANFEVQMFDQNESVLYDDAFIGYISSEDKKVFGMFWIIHQRPIVTSLHLSKGSKFHVKKEYNCTIEALTRHNACRKVSE